MPRRTATLVTVALCVTAVVSCSSTTTTPNGTVASEIAPWNGQNQNAHVGSALATPFTVRVTDSLDEPVSGVAITLTATDGTLGATSGVSGPDGTFSTTFTVGTTPREDTVTATIPNGLVPAVVVFTATP